MYRNSAYSRMKSPALTPRWFTRFKNALSRLFGKRFMSCLIRIKAFVKK